MARPIWSGNLTFGLVNIPIRLYSAIQEKRVSFHLLAADGSCRLREKMYCPETGKEYKYEETARGYEIEPHHYVILSPEELEQLGPKRTKTLELQQFVKLAEIDPVYFNRSYYLAPVEGAQKSYQLLLEVMRDAKKVGIGRFVMRQKEYLAALRAGDGLLVLETMYFAEEIRKPDEVGVSLNEVTVSQRELNLALQVVETLSEPWRPERYRNEYQQRVEEYVREKSMGKGAVKTLVEEAAEPTKVIDLMERLRASLKQSGKQLAREGNQTSASSRRKAPRGGRRKRRPAA